MADRKKYVKTGLKIAIYHMKVCNIGPSVGIHLNACSFFFIGKVDKVRLLKWYSAQQTFTKLSTGKMTAKDIIRWVHSVWKVSNSLCNVVLIIKYRRVYYVDLLYWFFLTSEWVSFLYYVCHSLKLINTVITFHEIQLFCLWIYCLFIEFCCLQYSGFLYRARWQLGLHTCIGCHLEQITLIPKIWGKWLVWGTSVFVAACAMKIFSFFCSQI